MRDEAVGLLQTLIRLNTVNPPGNETVAAEALADYLRRQGVECELYARTPERANPSPGSRAVTGRASPSSVTPTRSSPTRGNGRAIRGRATLPTSTSGPRRARYEEPGRSERGRVRVARARGFRAGRRPRLHCRRRQGGRRVVRARMALRGAPGRGARRLRGERGRRRAHRARWQAVLPLRKRGEDDRAVPVAGPRAERPRLGARNRRQRSRQSGAADRGARRLSTGA